MGNKAKNTVPLAQDDIKRLVADWGGFEKLIAELSDTGDVTVEHDVRLKGKSGAIRQVDVLIRHTQGLYEHTIIVECKYWNKRVSRLHVDALITGIDDLNASKGVIFSTVGFQSGAITQARSSGTELFTVRFPTNKEWGLPGRFIDFHLHVVAKSIAHLNFQQTSVLLDGTRPGPSQMVEVNLNFDEVGQPISATPIFRPILNVKFQELDGQPLKAPIVENIVEEKYPKTLEKFLQGAIQQAAETIWTTAVINDGGKWTRRFWHKVEIKPKHPIMMRHPDGRRYMLPKISLDVGLTISQTCIAVDRADKSSFVFAIEDKVRNLTKSASKEKDASIIVISKLNAEEDDGKKGPPLENGSIMTAWLGQIFGFQEFGDLPRGEILDMGDA